MCPTANRPWFLREPDERSRIITADKPAQAPTSDDVWFCIRAHRAGKKVGIDFAARESEHWTARCMKGGEALGLLEPKLEKDLAQMEADAKPPDVPAAPPDTSALESARQADPGLRIVR